MLWYKSWLETRWRFLIGLALLVLLGVRRPCFAYPQVVEAAADGADRRRSAARSAGGSAKRASSSRDYRGYVWSQWFRQNLPQMWTLFAVLLGTGGLLSQASGGGGAVHAVAAGVARPRCSACGPRPAWRSCWRSRSSRRSCCRCCRRPSARATASATRWSTARASSSRGAVFFSLAFLLSTVFSDVWRPLLIAAVRRGGLGISEPVLRDLSRYSLFGVMSGENYFRGRRAAVAGTARQRGALGGDALRRRQQPRAPGFLTRFQEGALRCVPFLHVVPVVALLLAPAPAPLAQSPADPSGHWEGMLQVQNMVLNVEVDLARNSSGEFAGTFSQPAQGVKGLPLATVAVEGRSVRFVVKGGDAPATFVGHFLRTIGSCPAKSARADSDSVHVRENRRREDCAGAEERGDRQGAGRQLERHHRSRREANAHRGEDGEPSPTVPRSAPS